MSEPSTCKHCNGTIYWHKSKAGRPYPTDSATDRRAFHKCEPKPQTTPPPQPTAIVSNPKPGAVPRSLQERVEWLEGEVRQLLIKVDRLEADNATSY